MKKECYYYFERSLLVYPYNNRRWHIAYMNYIILLEGKRFKDNYFEVHFASQEKSDYNLYYGSLQYFLSGTVLNIAN